jgi:integrase
MSHNMALTQVSRSPFASPDQPSLADVIDRIRAASKLLKITRQNWVWAVRTLARVAGKELAAIPAHPDFLRRLLARAAPASRGLGPGAWNNAKSLAGKAMEWSGLVNIPGHYMAPYTPEWQRLWSMLPANTALAVQLSRLFHYGSANGIRPADVNDDVLRQYHAALKDESLIANHYEAYRGAAKSWNNALAQIPGWPGGPVNVPSKRPEPFSLPWAAFPSSLSTQVEAHLASLAGVDLDSDFSRPMRPATIEKRRKQLLWFASAAVHSGTPAPQLDRLEVLLMPEMAKRVLEYLLTRRGGQTFTALDNLAQFLPALARRIGMPIEMVGALKRYKQRLRLERHGLAERHRPTLRRFDDPATVKALVTLPQRIRSEVERAKRKGIREAKLMQTAVAIEILLVAPVRISNLASIEISRHLVVVQAAPRCLHLRFPASEVKNAMELEFPLPPETMDLINLYLREYRHLLADEPGDFLFPGKHGGHKVNHALSHQINLTVHKHTSLQMPAHRFRHAVGKIFLDRHPGQYEVVRQLLGHKNIKTTIEFYAGAETAAAVRHYAQTILKLRNGGESSAANAL